MVVDDLKVGVTVAEGLVEAMGLALLTSTSGLMGVVVVEVPITLGRGADCVAYYYTGQHTILHNTV